MIKKIGKNFFALTISTILIISLVACGGNGDTADPVVADENGEAVEDVVDETTEDGNNDEVETISGDLSGSLSVQIWDTNQLAGIEEIVAAFSAETGVDVSVSVVSGDEYWTRIEAGIAGGDVVDIFWMHSNEAQRYMENGILLDLTDHITNSEKVDLDRFPDDIRELYVYEGRIYSMPKDIDTIALWYNRTLFEEAGIDTPNETWTWDHFYEVAVALTDPEAGIWGTAMNPGNDQDGWMNIIYSMGGYVINEDRTASGFDNPNTIAAMEFVDDLIRNAMPATETMAETYAHVLFQSGTVAMVTQGSWMLSGFLQNEYLVENANVAVLPMDANTGRRVSIYNGLGWAANVETENPEAAKALIEWFSTEEMQLKQARLGVTMSAFEGTSDAWANRTDVFNLNAHLEMLEDTVIRPYSRNSFEWLRPLWDTLREAWAENITMEEACLQIAEQMNGVLVAEQQ